MKKLYILSAIAALVLSTVSFNASAKNLANDTEDNSAVTQDFKMMVYNYEQSLIKKGYTITNITGNQIEAQKTLPSFNEFAKITSESPKKVKVNTITSTFYKTNGGYDIQVESGSVKKDYNEWYETALASIRNNMQNFRGPRYMHRGRFNG